MSKKKDYITLLSIISAISVVFLHANGCFWNFSKSRYWFTANIIESVFYFAVPIFFMITGANLIDYQDKYSTKDYFLKRIKKVLIPFIIWSIIGFFYILLRDHTPIHSIVLKDVVNRFLYGSIISIYWFFPPLICIYLSIPLFASVEKEKRKQIFSYLAIAGFVLNSFIPFILNVFNAGISIPYTIIVCNNYLLYVVIGYLLDTYDLNKKWRIIIYVLGIIGLLMHIVGTYKLSIASNEITKTFKGYLNVPCLLYSVSIFIFIKEICKKINLNKIINNIGYYTFSIYLIHWFLLDIFVRLFDINTKSIFYRLGIPFLVIPLCILITFIIRKIPVIKKIVP